VESNSEQSKRDRRLEQQRRSNVKRKEKIKTWHAAKYAELKKRMSEDPAFAQEVRDARSRKHRASKEKDPDYYRRYYKKRAEDPSVAVARRERMRKRYYADLEKSRASVRLNYHKHKDKRSGSWKKWADKKGNRERYNALQRERRKNNPQFAVSSNLRSRLNTALRAKNASKSTSTIDLIGCTVAFLMLHIEKQWLPGMTWANRGHRGAVWHIDHIVPCDAYDLTDPEQQRRCFHYSNLRPLWAVENVRKSAKRVPFPATQLELAPVVEAADAQP
jgi:hypothetical protein